MLVELLIPIALIVIGLKLSQVNLFFESPQKIIEPSMFGGR